MAKKLAEVDVAHQLITMSGKGHGFESDGLADPAVANALTKVVVFLKQYL